MVGCHGLALPTEQGFKSGYSRTSVRGGYLPDPRADPGTPAALHASVPYFDNTLKIRNYFKSGKVAARSSSPMRIALPIMITIVLANPALSQTASGTINRQHVVGCRDSNVYDRIVGMISADNREAATALIARMLGTGGAKSAARCANRCQPPPLMRGLADHFAE